VSEPAAPGLAIASETATTPGGATVAVAAFDGELDLATIEAFEEAVASVGEGPIVIDLTAVRFIDSSGIHGIVRARQARAERGVAAALVVAPRSAVDRVLEMSGLRESLDPKPDRTAALAALDTGTVANGTGR
jgi:anti-anti-sigma factor